MEGGRQRSTNLKDNNVKNSINFFGVHLDHGFKSIIQTSITQIVNCFFVKILCTIFIHCTIHEKRKQKSGLDLQSGVRRYGTLFGLKKKKLRGTIGRCDKVYLIESPTGHL